MKSAKEWDKVMPQEPFEQGKQAYEDFDAANLAFIRSIQADALEAAAARVWQLDYGHAANPSMIDVAVEEIRKLKEQP